MKPVNQVFDCDCMSACVASLLHLQLDQVPLFFDEVEGGRRVGQHERVQRWLYERGLTLVDIPLRTRSVATCRLPWEATRATYCIITLAFGPRSHHAVVGRACRRRLRVVHDPYAKPDRIEAKGRPISVGFIVPCDAGRWSRR